LILRQLLAMSAADQSKDIRPIQRFITTHTPDGKPTFSADIPEDAPFRVLPDGAEFALCYATNKFPVQMTDDEDLNVYKQYAQNLPGITIDTGSVLRVVDMRPGALSPMHRTISLDYGVVLEGEVELILDSGESRLMKRGDISVQRGTNHAWRNTSDTSWARMLYVLQPAEPLMFGGQALQDNTLATIPGHK
jgi:quercetin dioxygenase-like cupin family protein